MSKWNYIASTFKSTAVHDATISCFLQPSHRNLCIAKSERIEIYKILHDQLDFVFEIPMNSHIFSIKSLKSPSSLTDSLLILTQSRMLLQMSYENSPKVVSQITLSSRNSRNIDESKIILNPSESLVCVYEERSYFTLVKITQGKLQDSFQVYHLDMDITDFCFIGSANKLAVCYTTENIKASVCFYEIKVAEQQLTRIGQSFPFDQALTKVIPLSSGEVLMFFTNFYTQFDAACTEYCTKDFPDCSIKAIGKITETKWVLSNNKGKLFLLSSEAPLQIDYLGLTSVASCICYLDNHIIYLGSSSNHSKCLQILPESVNASFIQELQDFPNIAPIMDFNIIVDERQEVFDIITCSGVLNSGGFRKISKGVTAVQELVNEIANINGIWTISLNSNTHTHLFMSFYSKTQVFELLNSKISQFPLPLAISLNEKTIAVGVVNTLILHIVPSGIYIYSNTWDLIASTQSDTLQEGGKISHSHILPSTVCIVIGVNLLLLFDLLDNKLQEKWRLLCENEVSCLSGFRNFIAIGYWENKNLAVLDKDSGAVLYKEPSEFTAAARSIKFLDLRDTTVMIVGLRDGYLLYYRLRLASFVLEKKIAVGYTAIVLEELRSANRISVLAACDSPVILYNERDMVYSTNLNLSDISSATSFNTEAFPGCLAVVSKNQFSVVSLPELQKCSIKSYIKKITIRRIVHVEEKFVVISLNESQGYALQMYDSDKELIESIEFPETELLNCIHTVNSRIYLGSGVGLSKEELRNSQNLTGHIKTYSIVNSRLHLLSTLEVGRLVTCIQSTPTHLIAGVYNEIHFFDITETGLSLSDSNQKMTYVLCIDVFLDLIAVADLVKSISIYKPSDNKLKLCYKNYTTQFTTAIKFISAKLLVSADHFGNIFVLEIMPSNILEPIAGINIGIEIINCIRGVKLHKGNQTTRALVLATSHGRVATILDITEKKYRILKALQECLCAERNWVAELENRAPRQEDRAFSVGSFIQGDVVEIFLELSGEKQSTLALMVSEKVREAVAAGVIGDILYDLIKLH